MVATTPRVPKLKISLMRSLFLSTVVVRWAASDARRIYLSGPDDEDVVVPALRRPSRPVNASSIGPALTASMVFNRPDTAHLHLAQSLAPGRDLHVDARALADGGRRVVGDRAG